MSALLLDQQVDGAVAVQVSCAETITTWDPGILEPAVIDALRVGERITNWPVFTDVVRLDREDRSRCADTSSGRRWTP